MPLTVKECDHAQPAATARKLFDGGGLYLLVRPNGTKLWQLAYRHLGKPRTASFGEYASDPRKGVTLAKAREKRDDAKRQIRDGVDPVQARRAAVAPKSGIKTFKEVANEWIAKINKKPRAGKTQDRDTRMVNKLVTAFGHKAVTDIEPKDVIRVLDAYENNGSYETRRRAQATAMRIMAYARGKQYVPINPLVGAGFNDSYTAPDQTLRPAITDTKDREPFRKLLCDVWSYRGRNGNLVGIALKLLTLTMVRPGTVCNAEWSEFDLDGDAPMWVIPFAKLKQRTFREKIKELVDKPHEVPPSRQAVGLLRELQGLTGNSRFLFPGVRRKTKKTEERGVPDPGPVSTNGLENALNSMGYQGVHCPHGFRSSASTLLNAERRTIKDSITGENIEMPRFAEQAVEFQLEHVNESQAADYNRDPRMPERTRMLQHWADLCDELRTGNRPLKLRVVA